MTADEIIAALGLMPHPEGGYFRETFRDPEPDGGRGHSTAIYFLLRGGQISRWHRVDAVEIWHWHAGAALALSIAAPDADVTIQRLGPDVLAGDRPQGIVRKGYWQQAQSLGDWTLVGCTVSPAFEFDGFEMAAPDFQPSRKSGAG